MTGFVIVFGLSLLAICVLIGVVNGYVDFHGGSRKRDLQEVLGEVLGEHVTPESLAKCTCTLVEGEKYEIHSARNGDGTSFPLGCAYVAHGKLYFDIESERIHSAFFEGGHVEQNSN